MRVDKKRKPELYDHSPISSLAVQPRNAWHWDSTAFRSAEF